MCLFICLCVSGFVYVSLCVSMSVCVHMRVLREST